MHIESGAADAGAVEDVLYGDGVEVPLMEKRHEGIAQPVARTKDAAICFTNRPGALRLCFFRFHNQHFRTDAASLSGI